MAKTHDFGPAFVQSIRIKKNTKRFHFAPTQETDEPFRRSKSLVVRLWGEVALVLGWWRDSGMEETEALLAAIGGGIVDARLKPAHDVWLADKERLAEYRSPEYLARATVSKHTNDFDDEWRALQMLGLDQ